MLDYMQINARTGELTSAVDVPVSGGAVIGGYANRVKNIEIAHDDVRERLGLLPDDDVRLIGAPASLRETLGTPYAHHAGRRVFLFWPSNESSLRAGLGHIRAQLGPRDILWIMTGQPGHLGRAALAAPSLLAFARSAGLVDSKCVFLNRFQYGYRFSLTSMSH